MGRPREHDDETRAALLAVAEQLVAADGPDALAVRAVARGARTTTRAVYSVFGSKDGLLAALARQAIQVLDEGLLSVPVTDDPVADIVEVGAGMYRRFVLEHPSLYRLAFQRILPGLELGDEFLAARARTWTKLEARFVRLEQAGMLPARSARAAAVEFNAMCEGLAAAELRGGTMRDDVSPDDHERVWRDAFRALLAGLTGRPPCG